MFFILVVIGLLFTDLAISPSDLGIMFVFDLVTFALGMSLSNYTHRVKERETFNEIFNESNDTDLSK